MNQNPTQSHRTRWNMPEVLTQLGWSESDLRDAIMSGQLVPCYYVNAGVWVYDLDVNGGLQRRTPAIFKNEWLYAVRFKQTSANDGHFEALSETTGPFQPGAVFYGLTGNSMVRGHVVHLHDVLAHGTVAVAELHRFRSSLIAPTPTTQPALPSGKVAPWWCMDYDLVQMAEAEKTKRTASGYGMVQRGARAGKHPLKAISEALSKHIQEAEKNAGSDRKIGAKSIENYLRKGGVI
jgi:hypothetical protein